MFFEEFPPVADNRPTDSLWFHQLVDLSSTVDDSVEALTDGSAGGPVTVRLYSGAGDAECTLVLPRQRQPSWQS